MYSAKPFSFTWIVDRTTIIVNRIMLQQSCYQLRNLSLLTKRFLGALVVIYMTNLFYNYRLLFQGQQQQVHQVTPVKLFPIVLYWTKFYDMNDFGIGVGRATFSHQCSQMEGSDRCLTTMDRNNLNDSDAILFHGQDIDVDDLPPPQWRRPHQHFIFVLQESPVYTKFYKFQLSLFNNYFNRTITYRRDSDIPVTYGRLQCIGPSPPCFDFPRNDVITDTLNSSARIEIDLTLKNRTVAWFVSNCQTNSQRELLVHKLSRFIPIDIFGGCGKTQCLTNADCDSMLSRYYRFYLSFENSLCIDYVTEKLYRPLLHNTVPVVYGGSNYSFHLPVGSYVDARDFNSVRSLANYLNKLMVDDELYLSYFQWRGRYTVNPWPGDWCRLCKMLRDTSTNSKIYSNISTWWTGSATNRTCVSPPASLVSL